MDDLLADAAAPVAAPSDDPVFSNPPPAPSSNPPQRDGALRLIAYLAIVTLAWAVMTLWGLGKAPFHTKGEPREGLVVWEMTHGGGWILPLRNGVEVPSKPPLFHWLGAATTKLTGATNEWSIRFPSALLSLLSLYGVLLAGAALWEARAGLFAVLSLMTMFEWSRAAANARVDMTLTFGLQAAFLCLLFFLRTRSPRWLLALYGGIVVAILGKGFVGLLLPGLVGLAMILLSRDLALLRQMRLLRGTAIVAVGAGFWYAAALFVGGTSFFRKQILGEQLFTYLNNPDSGWRGHRHSWLYLPGSLLLGLLPWTPFLIGTTAQLWRSRKQWTWNDPRVFLLVWIGVLFLFYEAAAQKRSVYLLGLYPAVALLLGAWWSEQASRPRDEWLALVALWFGRVLLTVLIVLMIILGLEALGAPLLATVAPYLSRSARLVIPGISEAVRADRLILATLLSTAAAALYALTRVAQRQHWAAIFAALFLATMALQASVRLVFLPGVARQQTLRDFMREVRSTIGPSQDLQFYKAFEYGAVFYFEGHILPYKGPWPTLGPKYLLMKESDWEAQRENASGFYELVEMHQGLAGRIKEPLVLVRRSENAPALLPTQPGENVP